MMGTDVTVRGSFDLTRAPDEAWNAQMVELITRQLFRGMDVTVGTVRYCLAIAEGLGLNPLVDEVYFIPSKSRDGKGPAYKPYIGRNGLVAKATERGYYYESETVYKGDRIRINRRKNGDVEVVHSYDPTEDRGSPVGAYSFLHKTDGSEKPAFFWAPLKQYLPTFDADWKMAASPWGNQLDAMIEKCSMIGAGRKRLRLGNLLSDGEIPMYEAQGRIGPRSGPPADVADVDFGEFTDDEVLADRLRTGALRAGWSAAKVSLVMTGRTREQLEQTAAGFEGHANRAPTQATPAAPGQAEGETPGGGSEPGPDGRGAENGSEAVEAVRGEVVDSRAVDHDKIRGLEKRKAGLEDSLNDPTLLEDHREQIAEELDGVERELAAALDSGQSNLFG